MEKASASRATMAVPGVGVWWKSRKISLVRSRSRLRTVWMGMSRAMSTPAMVACTPER